MTGPYLPWIVSAASRQQPPRSTTPRPTTPRRWVCPLCRLRDGVRRVTYAEAVRLCLVCVDELEVPCDVLAGEVGA